MYDDAPRHWARCVRDSPDRWIARSDSSDNNIHWPPMVPDLTPMNIFALCFIKQKVHASKYENLPEFKAAITTAFQEITVSMISYTPSSFEYRRKIVVELKNGYVEK